MKETKDLRELLDTAFEATPDDFHWRVQDTLAQMKYMEYQKEHVAKSHEDVSLPWTTDFSDTYKKAYGDDTTSYLILLSPFLPNLSKYHLHE